MKILGKLFTVITVGNRKFHCFFAVVRDFPFKVLLGSDFLIKNQAVFDFKNDLLRLGEHTITLSQQVGPQWLHK